MRQKLGIILCVLIVLSNPSALFAQQAASSSAAVRTQSSSSQTKKDIVKNFRINLNKYSSFGTDCSQKQRGDANCDAQINQFDLSIWEVEFNSLNSPKRSDFNNDGVINLLDYGIWRNTSFPQNPSPLNSLILNLKSLILSTVYAQEGASGGGEINSSSTFTSDSGNSMVINTITGGNTQQVNFDPTGNPQTASFFDPNGNSYAEIAFTNSGTIIATEENGIPITISKTATGPIIENFRNPDGSPLAIKSWPSQQSYDSNQPPIAVTIPGQGATKEVLNMQPNGDAIVDKLDAAGNIITRTQLRSNGTIVTEDFKSSTLVQSNTEVGFTNLSMKNNLGGQTQYMFYQGTLYAIVQSDAGNNSYISKPLNSSGTSWSFETLKDGVKRSEKTTSDPILEAKSNTPNPQSLIQYINYYKQASLPSDSITFSEGFTSTAPAIANPVNRANAILAISTMQKPTDNPGFTVTKRISSTHTPSRIQAYSVLGIIKEAHAQTAPSQPTPPQANLPAGYTIDQTAKATEFDTGDGWTFQFDVRNPQGQTVGNIQVQLPNADSTALTANTPNFGQITTNARDGTPIDGRPILSRETLEAIREGGSMYLAANMVAPMTTGAPPDPAAPPPPAPPAAQPPQGAGMNESATALDAGAKAAQAAGERGESPAQQAKAGYDAAYAKTQEYAGFGQEKAQNLANDVFSHSFLTASLKEKGVDDAALQNITGRDLAQMAADRGISITQVNTARSEQGLPSISSPFSAQSGQSGPAGTPASAPAAAAATAPGITPPQSGLMADGINTSTVKDLGNGNFQSTISNASGEVVAIQTHSPSTGVSTWNDTVTGETFTANSGTLTTATIDVSAPGSIVGISAYDGSLVAVGDASFINEQGYLEGGRPATEQEVAAFQEQQAEQAAATGAEQYSVSFDPEGSGESENWSENGYQGNSVDQGGNFGGEQVGSEAGPDTTSDTSQSFSNDNFNNDTSNGSDANSSGADSSGW